jgi:hypothetical protein
MTGPPAGTMGGGTGGIMPGHSNRSQGEAGQMAQTVSSAGQQATRRQGGGLTAQISVTVLRTTSFTEHCEGEASMHASSSPTEGKPKNMKIDGSLDSHMWWSDPVDSPKHTWRGPWGWDARGYGWWGPRQHWGWGGGHAALLLLLLHALLLLPGGLEHHLHAVHLGIRVPENVRCVRGGAGEPVCVCVCRGLVGQRERGKGAVEA